MLSDSSQTSIVVNLYAMNRGLEVPSEKSPIKQITLGYPIFSVRPQLPFFSASRYTSLNFVAKFANLFCIS